ncbi:endonuclease/exonuclease/phosphatase family protein [Mucilaginibacter antarcticus]|uniref:Endonuclease/exonuclease/phosphatase family protein n=1 Tax=Mucilaginibacter antarcticus TaxID=1855725 RepID=A0ABW5XKW0_9SPHI
MNLVIVCVNCLILLFTLLSLVKNAWWLFRIFDYPRLQKLVLALVCLPLTLAFYRGDTIVLYAMIGLMLANIVYLSTQIYPFTPLAGKQVLKATRDIPGQCLSLMIANVYQDNKNWSACLKQVQQVNADVVLLLETDHQWDQRMSPLADTYPYSVRVPLPNTYGMLLYSKLELVDTQVKYLVEPGIPSIHTDVLLPDGTRIKIFALHPTPPVPTENPRSTERDKELLLVADLAKASTLPVIVLGDMNDVAWSYTTELFLKMSGLIDPRRGRGFYNTFHAHYPFMRFPLDHAFISTHFKLGSMKRLNNCGSDHFPIYLSIQYEEQATQQQDPMQPDADDIEVAAEKKEAV